MKIHFENGDLTQCGGRVAMVLADRDGHILNGHPAVNAILEPFATSGELGKSNGQHVYISHTEGLSVSRLLLVNIGDPEIEADQLRRATAEGWKALRTRGFTSVALSLDGLDDEAQVRAALEGLFLGEYTYTDLKTDKDNLPNRLENLHLTGAEKWRGKISVWEAICGGTNRARDLCQMPPNILNPTTMAELAVKWGETFGLKTTVLEEDTLKAEGMNTLLSVSQGSEQPAKLILFEYEPANPSGKTFAFVGKAVTFDSGGLSLKPPASMPEMKGDMGGGAAVFGIMTSLRDAKCPHRVVGVVPAVENMPSGSATRPSDVVKSLSGITVEINNTDAEGRLILADALTYAGRYKPDYVVDFATLTGACLVALGTKIFGVMGNHKPLVNAIIEAGEDVNEPFWELPLYKGYEDMLKSSVADTSNIGNSRWGGTIVAGLFLKRFAGDYQWAHCDIAAAIFEKSDAYQPEGGTGAGVRMGLRMMELMGS